MTTAAALVLTALGSCDAGSPAFLTTPLQSSRLSASSFQVRSSSISMQVSSNKDDLRRQSLSAALAGALLFSSVSGSLPGGSLPASAIGPVNIELNNMKYEAVTCPPELAAGRIGGAVGGGASRGVKQTCIQVTADAFNPDKKAVTDAAVFGYVTSSITGSSVLASNPDGRSDAGQMAIIPSVGPKETQVKFVFVATNPANEDMGTLQFSGMKAISYPGGARYQLYDQCEANPFAEECD